MKSETWHRKPPVILHFGAKKDDISTTGVAIPDPESLLWGPS